MVWSGAEWRSRIFIGLGLFRLWRNFIHHCHDRIPSPGNPQATAIRRNRLLVHDAPKWNHFGDSIMHQHMSGDHVS